MTKRRQIHGDMIQFRSPVTWFVSSSQKPFLENFVAALVHKRLLQIERHRLRICMRMIRLERRTGLQIERHRLRIADVEVLPQPRFRPKMTFRCLSPITMSTTRQRDNQSVTHFCLPDDPQFSELVGQSLIRKYEAIYQEPPPDSSFAMIFDKAYMDKKNGAVTRLVNYKGVKIRGGLSVPCNRCT